MFQPGDKCLVWWMMRWEPGIVTRTRAESLAQRQGTIRVRIVRDWQSGNDGDHDVDLDRVCMVGANTALAAQIAKGIE